MNWVENKFSNPPRKKKKCANEVMEKLDFCEESETLLLNWRPRTKKDLVVHNKRIDEIEDWLICMKKRDVVSRVLVLFGPPGCGKLTTLRILCSELHIDLVEWTPQVSKCPYDPNVGGDYESELSLFEGFVMRATRYASVLSSGSCRLIVVKDIPNCFIRDKQTFYQFLLTYMPVQSVYLAFVLTDAHIVRNLFSDQIKSDFNVQTVTFNPATQKGVSSTLLKISQGKFPEHIHNISLTCNGDLRNAITTLQFVAVKGRVPKKLKRKETPKPTDAIDLFRGLGRILYSKRETSGKLTHCPIEVADSFATCPDLFLGMLQRNYLETFSSIHHVAGASDKLALSDILLKDSKISSAQSLNTALNLAAFSLMSLNKKPIKKFQQFNKPEKITPDLATARSLELKDVSDFIDLSSFARYLPHFLKENPNFRLSKFCLE